MKTLIVVNEPSDWSFSIPEVEVVKARSYLTEAIYSSMRRVRVINLCRSYRYQSTGYYVSLLARARGHRPLPGSMALEDMKSQVILRIISEELNELMVRSLAHLHDDKFELSVYFGKTEDPRLERLGRKLFSSLEAPLLRARFVRIRNEWKFQSIVPISASVIPDKDHAFVEDAAISFLKKTPTALQKKKMPVYDMAILVNPDEKYPPSDKKALARFRKAAESMGIVTEFINKDDFSWIPHYDALFIRETTAVNHHTYRFARKADAEGLVVIDDPESILRCTNKVYLEELLRRNKIRTPSTVIAHKDNLEKLEKDLSFPMILKIPDSSFSQGVMKVEDRLELKEATTKILAKTDLFIAQKFLFTDYDWRVGVLNNEVLYVCRYHMARDHWQIQGKDGRGGDTYGSVDAVSIEEAPQHVIETAKKAAALIGDGFYGVDLKESGGHCYVIEVNDNPSVEVGFEDGYEGDRLYQRVMEVFLQRMTGKGKSQ